jgi:hypothetical protein
MRVLIVLVSIVVVLGVAMGLLNRARHRVPLPFKTVVSRGDTVVATVQPGLYFSVRRANNPETKSISGSDPLELQNGSSVELNSGHSSYRVTCRTSPPPAGLYIEGQWYLHDLLSSYVEKSFIKAQ